MSTITSINLGLALEECASKGEEVRGLSEGTEFESCGYGTPQLRLNAAGTRLADWSLTPCVWKPEGVPLFFESTIAWTR
jgi:hypothetical protein